MQDPLLFTLTVLAILGTPGPTNTLLATAGAMAGVRHSLLLLPAEAAGYLVTIVTLGTLVGPALAATPLLATILRLAVAAYLLHLARHLWRQGEGAAGEARPVHPRQIFVTTLLNPKAILFALAVIPFGAPGLWAYLLGFVLLLAAVGLAWLTLGAALGRITRPTWIPRAGASALGLFACLLVWSALRS